MPTRSTGRNQSAHKVGFCKLFLDEFYEYGTKNLEALRQPLEDRLINLFVARGPDPTTALATLAVVYTLGRIPYGWLNEIRSLASAFRIETLVVHQGASSRRLFLARRRVA